MQDDEVCINKTVPFSGSVNKIGDTTQIGMVSQGTDINIKFARRVTTPIASINGEILVKTKSPYRCVDIMKKMPPSAQLQMEAKTQQ